jgi:energy-converting hydrogenase A subunit M
MLQIKIIKHASLEFRRRLLKLKAYRKVLFYEKKNVKKNNEVKNQKKHIVKSAIEGIVFIKTTKNTKIFMGEIIDILVCKDKFSRLKSLKGMVIGLSIESAEIMLFGDTSEISPGNI